MPSRRTPRTATRAPSAYLCAVLASSVRRSVVSCGIGTRTNCPSDAGFSPSPESRIAFSTAPTRPRSQTCTVSMRASGVPTLPTWVSGISVP